jgi:hypothetical protein
MGETMPFFKNTSSILSCDNVHNGTQNIFLLIFSPPHTIVWNAHLRRFLRNLALLLFFFFLAKKIASILGAGRKRIPLGTRNKTAAVRAEMNHGWASQPFNGLASHFFISLPRFYFSFRQVHQTLLRMAFFSYSFSTKRIVYSGNRRKNLA